MNRLFSRPGVYTRKLVRINHLFSFLINNLKVLKEAISLDALHFWLFFRYIKNTLTYFIVESRSF